MTENPKQDTAARILICEDEVILATGIAQSLREFQYEVVGTVCSGEDAVSAAQETEPDLILMDMKLKGRIDGIEAVEQIRAQMDVPVVYITAYDDEDVLERAKLSGPYGYLRKPLSKLEFKCIVETALYRHEADRRVWKNDRRLSFDVEAMAKLREISELFTRERKLDEVLAKILEMAIEFTSADKGNIQLVDPNSGTLKIVVHQGFERPFLNFWDDVRCGRGACGTALERGERVVIEDVTQSPVFVGTPALEVQLEADVRAVQSTPLMSYAGRMIGVISTHWTTQHRREEHKLRLLDLLARLAADIIERVRNEESLKESEELHRETMSEISDTVFITKETGDFIYVSPNTHLIFGYSQAEVKALGNVGYFLDETLIDKARLGRLGEIRNAEVTIKDKLGKEHSLLVNVKRVNIKSGTILYICRDITERKKAEEALRESEEKYRTLFEESFDGLFVTSPGGRILDMNKKGVAMFGYDTKEEILRLDLERDVYAHPTDRQRILSLVNAQGSAEYEVAVKKKSGEEMLTYCALTAVRDERGGITSYRGIIRDITELTQVRLRLENQRVRLQTLVRTIPDLV